jgi:hypothetical protein
MDMALDICGGTCAGADLLFQPRWLFAACGAQSTLCGAVAIAIGKSATQPVRQMVLVVTMGCLDAVDCSDR